MPQCAATFNSANGQRYQSVFDTHHLRLKESTFDVDEAVYDQEFCKRSSTQEVLHIRYRFVKRIKPKPYEKEADVHFYQLRSSVVIKISKCSDPNHYAHGPERQIRKKNVTNDHDVQISSHYNSFAENVKTKL